MEITPITGNAVIALDIGGTNMRAAIIDMDRFEIHDFLTDPSPQTRSFDDFVAAVHGKINELREKCQQARIVGVGIAIPGPFDYEHGISQMTHKFVSLPGKSLLDPLNKNIQHLAPIFFLNDALAFSLGARLEVAPWSERFVGVTLGTGLGGAFLLHGFPAGMAQGAPRSGGIWDFHYPPDGGINAKLEHCLSGRAIRWLYATKVGTKPEDLPIDFDSPDFDEALNKFHVPDVKKISEKASKGDNFALATWKEFGEDLGRGLQIATAAFRPDLIAIGGLITEAKRYFEPSAKSVSGGLQLKFLDVEQIERAALRGVAMYVYQRLNPQPILIVPNEDGLGPSSLAFHVAAEIADRVKNRDGGLPPAQIVIRNRNKKGYQQWLYQEDIKRSLVRLEPIYNIIELGKKSGRVGFDETLSNLIRYPRLAELYGTLPLIEGSDSGQSCAGVIDVGVPAVCRAAAQRSVPRITIFDHKWSTTFEKIAGLYASDPLFLRGQKELGDALLRAITAVKEDEAKTNLVFLFPTFLTPEEYHKAWRQETNALIVEIGGVFGGGPRLISRIRESIRQKILNKPITATNRDVNDDVEGFTINAGNAQQVLTEVQEMLRTSAAAAVGVDILSPKVLDKAMKILEERTQVTPTSPSTPISQSEGLIPRAIRELVAGEAADEVMDDYIESVIVRKILGIEEKNIEPIAFVSGGGTAVWTAAMYTRIVSDALRLEAEDNLRFNLVVCPPDEVYRTTGLPDTLKKRRDAIREKKPKDERYVVSGLKSVNVEVWKPQMQGSVRSKKIRFLGDVENSTYQEIFPGVDLIVSRAGGGTTNDAIACRTPICFVEEPNHWQVEAIRENMMRAGLARTIGLEEFKINPVAIIRRELLERQRENGLIKAAMAKIPNEREKYVVDIIVDYLFNRREFFAHKLDEIEGP